MNYLAIHKGNSSVSNHVIEFVPNDTCNLTCKTVSIRLANVSFDDPAFKIVLFKTNIIDNHMGLDPQVCKTFINCREIPNQYANSFEDVYFQSRENQYNWRFEFYDTENKPLTIKNDYLIEIMVK